MREGGKEAKNGNSEGIKKMKKKMGLGQRGREEA